MIEFVLKRKTCSIHDLADNELRLRDMDLPEVSAELHKRFLTDGNTEECCASHGQYCSWTEHVINEKAFDRAYTKTTLRDGLLKRRLAFHGHLVRKGGITLDLMIGRLHGNRPRGRPRTTWLKDLVTQANIIYLSNVLIDSECRAILFAVLFVLLV